MRQRLTQQRPPNGKHTVAQGEWLSKIAQRYGFADWHDLWNDPNNAPLKARGNPNLLHPGEQVYIPELKTAAHPCHANSESAFIVRRETVKFRIALENIDGKPRGEMEYVVEVDGTVNKVGKTKADGLVEFTVPDGALRAALLVGDWNSPEVYHLTLGLSPVETVIGCQQRLANLGYYRGPIDGIVGPLTHGAVREFLTAEGLAAGDELSEEFKKQLRSRHGC